MAKVYVSHNNCISSLGFSSHAVVTNVAKEVSGLKKIEDSSILQQPFYSSLIDRDQLHDYFTSFGFKGDFTHLEQMMISALKPIIDASELSLTARVGLILSTTKGNVDALDTNNSFVKERAYLSVLADVIASTLGFKTTPVVLSNACVSGVMAVAVAKRYIQQDLYDDVFVVSGDIVTEFILSGFNSFQALSSEPCKPYDKNRIGINIGEVAASVLVTKDKHNLVPEAVEILGDGTSNDANHISGPSRTGEGLVRSISSACKEADVKPEAVDFISAHGTATMFNDEMEAIAFNRLGMQDIPLHSLKGYFGHTLGASGLIETIIGMHGLHTNTLYKSLGFDTLGVTQPIKIISETTTSDKSLSMFLKTASGFGGCNTAVVFKKVN